MSQDATDIENDPTAKETSVTTARINVEIHPNRSREGFTLVELMVVIGIIALLAALITPAVIGARTSARNAAIKAEIDMLHMAIMNYKNEYGSFPPCLLTGIWTGTTTNVSHPGYRHLARAFPRLAEARDSAEIAVLRKPIQNGGRGLASYPSTSPYQALEDINQVNSITFWLRGYFADPSFPLTNAGVSDKPTKLFDFDQSRISVGGYHPSGLKDSPYVYIDSASYQLIPYTPALISAGGVGAQRMPVSPPPAGDASDFTNTAQPFLNPDTFQILCAGLDATFGTDDDLSNCWPGTRKQYLDSLKQ